MSFSKFTEQDYALITREYAELKELARGRCANERELSIVQRAFEFANEAHKDVRRRSGEPYILHPIAVAKIVIADIGLGYKSIVAALLHDVVEDTDYTTEDIRNLFGDKIATLVDGLTKIKTVLDNEHKDHTMLTESLQAENFKRILLTLNDDVRVALIKLADRLHNCRTIEFMPEHKREKILSETMFIFIPLAHRLGLYSIKSEMENIWLRYKEPDAYNDISARISQNVEAREKDIDDFIAPIDAALRKAGFDFHIIKRVKTPYSIWRKMRTKHVTFDKIYDLYAVRIVFNPSDLDKETERDQCYHVFSIITGLYQYQPERMRDWVKQPKSNGYEALHCTLMSHAGVWIEVQIRTKRMDDIAEKGIAAHWAYKREGFVSENDSEMENWLTKVKEILAGADNVNALELLDIIHEDLTCSEITVFTPKGQQKTVQNGSTALDFAYQIHTEIGNRAIAAKINQKLVPLSQKLKAGDMVEIITADSGHPKIEWLRFLRTHHAISIVMDFFRGDNAQLIVDGRHKLELHLQSKGEKVTNETLKRLLAGTQLPFVDELYFRIAVGVINTSRIDDILADPQYSGSRTAIHSGYGRNGEFVIATCCNPIPGDPVIGIKSPNGVLTIHKKTCKEADKTASRHGDWVVVPDWSQIHTSSEFPVRIELDGIDRIGLLNEITRFISLTMGVNIRDISLKADGGIFEGRLDMLVKDRSALDEIIKNLESIPGVQNVTRIHQ